MRHSFPLFQSHLDLAHAYWFQLVKKGDTVIDATCGNGHDTLQLCKLSLSNDQGKVYAFDIQAQAIAKTAELLNQQLSENIQKKVQIEQRCHSTFPSYIEKESIKLIIYNLGYLPGSDKNLTTQTSLTLESLKEAQQLLQPGGMISMTCYPGHEEGKKEQETLLVEMSCLSPKEWSCCHHTWLNRQQAPSLLIMQKAIN